MSRDSFPVEATGSVMKMDSFLRRQTVDQQNVYEKAFLPSDELSRSFQTPIRNRRFR